MVTNGISLGILILVSISCIMITINTFWAGRKTQVHHGRGSSPPFFCREIVEKTLALNLFYVWQRTGDDFIVPLIIM